MFDSPNNRRSEMLETVEICNASRPDASIIWLHGLGADGHDFVPVVEALQLTNIRFVLPHAPYRAVTLNNGYEMRAWYDLYGLSLNSPQDENGIRQSQLAIETLIEREVERGIAASRIVLAGFSQGGAIALHTGLRYKDRLAGLLALSTYLPLKPQLEYEASSANRDLPIFMAHGLHDSIITPETAKLSLQALRANGYRPHWVEYNMAHSVCPDEIDDIRAFLQAIL